MHPRPRVTRVESVHLTLATRLCTGAAHRCRLSASPATGLVGMQENAFLSDFFGCVGFLPLTTQRWVPYPVLLLPIKAFVSDTLRKPLAKTSQQTAHYPARNIARVFPPSPTISQIRETMVKMMARPAEIGQPLGGVWHDCSDAAGGAPDAIATGGNLSTAPGGKQLPVDPPTCIFWCAVALGALVKGYPLESVRSSPRCTSIYYVVHLHVG